MVRNVLHFTYLEKLKKLDSLTNSFKWDSQFLMVYFFVVW